MNLKMKHPPLTLEEAQALCAKSQHLVGRLLNPQIHAHGRIERVIVAPCIDRAQQKVFAETLMDNVAAPFETFTNETEYTVLVVGRPIRWVQQSVLFLDVRSYLRTLATRIKQRTARLIPVAA
jgi:hypothetical protein